MRCRLPLRVGGQALRVNVSDARIDPTDGNGKKNTKQYRTWNTLHPVTLELNMMELFTLFRALALYQSKGLELGEDIAKDIWVQLSEYGQERLQTLAKDWMMNRLVPLGEEIDLANYLDNLQNEDGNSAHGFRTERELLDSEAAYALEETCGMFYKAGRNCNVEYGRWPETHILEHQKIVNYENGIFSFRNADDRTAPVTEIPEDEIERLELCE